MEKIKKILITGANGMIGSAIIRELINKYELILLAPRTHRIEEYADRATIIKSDLLEVNVWQGMLDNVYCVVHLAAAVHWMPMTIEEERQFIKTNAEGTRILYNACIDHGVERFLFFSTNDVYAVSDQLITERTATDPQGFYGKSKLLAEQYLRKSSKGSKTAVCIFRPASVYGQNDKGSMKSLIAFCRKGIVPMIGKGANKKTLLYLKDIVQATARYIESENDLDGEVFNISSGDYGYKEIIDSICDCYGLNPLRVYIPTWFCKKVASKVGPLKKLAVAGEIKIVSNDKATKILRYKGKYSLADGLMDAKSYYGVNQE
ncbi:NAD-dependent epimerase/dehydratase family protein [Desulfosporosinus lacus]|uniref:Nucleoside-diphosphate-sugar epimerase n=1 Tax=Desulfosporosinus lacus DSM 15449 TaxID=1121420 RepID=A0A1M5SJG9_9FIRM|nr:NAD(P)-dependent oxidoreductase [Desulfosporosinus lacus]SHH38540.1 Nucleoside-diphosphate-sugar epimerase [Desulfosporosinus lacus DSM 15449]